MSITVEIHPSVEAALKKHLTDTVKVSLEQFKKDLTDYLNRRKRPWYMGRDFPLNRPDSAVKADLRHMHVFTPIDKDRNPRTVDDWLYIDIPSKKVRFQNKRTSDTWVIYCFGFSDNQKCCVVGFADPTAHDDCERVTYVGKFSDIADDFRQNN